MASSEELTWKQIPVHFAAHMAVGVAMFVLVGSAALVLHFFVMWLEHLQLPAWMLFCTTLIEYGMFACDIGLFVIFIGRSVWSHARLMVTTSVDRGVPV